MNGYLGLFARYLECDLPHYHGCNFNRLNSCQALHYSECATTHEAKVTRYFHGRIRAMAPAMICISTPTTHPSMIIVVQRMCGFSRNTITYTAAKAVNVARNVPTALRNSAESTCLLERPLGNPSSASKASGGAGFYLGIDTPPLAFHALDELLKGRSSRQVDTAEFLSAVGTFLATLSAFAAVSVIVFRENPHILWTTMIMLGWVVGVLMQIIAGAITRIRT
jgi:hypothetical protein